MSLFLKWSGVISLFMLIATLGITLTMMWHPDWMDANKTPPSQLITQIAGIIAIIIGLVGIPASFALGQWGETPVVLRVFQVVAFLAAGIAAWRTLT